MAQISRFFLCRRRQELEVAVGWTHTKQTQTALLPKVTYERSQTWAHHSNAVSSVCGPQNAAHPRLGLWTPLTWLHQGTPEPSTAPPSSPQCCRPVPPCSRAPACVTQVEHTQVAHFWGSTQLQRADVIQCSNTLLCAIQKQVGFLQDTPPQNGKAISFPIKRSTCKSCSSTVQPQMLPKFPALNCSPCAHSQDFHLFTAVCFHRRVQYCSNELHSRWKGTHCPLSNGCTGPTIQIPLRQGLSSFPSFSPCSQESYSPVPDTWAAYGG